MRLTAPAATTPKWIAVLAFVAIAAGLACRTSDAFHKIYYQDEAVTSVRAAGYELADISRLFDGRPHGYDAIARFAKPSADHPLSTTLVSLAEEDPQHPPVFYGLEAIWARLVGTGSLAMRSLAVALSLLLFPLAYALAWELFRSRATAWIATALFAASPFFTLYAYQAREYGLLPVTIALASVLFLRARRLGGVGRYALYAASVALGLYTYPLFAFAVLAHGVVALATIRRDPRSFVAFAASAAVGALAFAPWFVVFLQHRATAAADVDWATSSYPLAYVAAKWAFFSAATFFDLEYLKNRYAIVALAVLGLEAVAVVSLVRSDRRDAALFVAALGLTAFAGLAIPDFILHHRFSTIARYLVPTWMAFVLAVAAFFGERPHSRTTRFGLPALLLVALWSSATSSLASSWWENNGSRSIPAVAAFLRAEPGTIVASEADEFPMLDLALVARPRGSWIGFPVSGTPPLRTSPRTYLLSPSAAVRSQIRTSDRVRLRLAYDSHDFRTNLSRFRSGVQGQHAGDNDWGEMVLWQIEPQ